MTGAATLLKDTVKDPPSKDKDTTYAFPSRELFMLVKGNFAQVAQFVCPSTGHEPDPLWGGKIGDANVGAALGIGNPTDTVPASQLWDFLGPDNLDYGYMWGHDQEGEALNESLDPQCALMADSNPYVRTQLTILGLPPAASHRRAWS